MAGAGRGITGKEIHKWHARGLVRVKANRVILTEDGWEALLVMLSVLGASLKENVAQRARDMLETLGSEVRSAKRSEN